MTTRIIQTDDAPQAIGPYNQAVKIGNMVYTSGNISLNAAGEKVGEGDIEAQSRQVMENLKAVLAAAGCGLEDVVKTTCFLADMNDFAAFNGVYGSYFDAATAPARSTVQVARLPLDVMVEVEAVAVCPE